MRGIDVLFLVLGLMASDVRAQALAPTGSLIPGRESSAMVATFGSTGVVSTDVDQPTETALSTARLMAACAAKKDPRTIAAIIRAPDQTGFNMAIAQLQPILERCAGSTVDAKGVTASTFRFSRSTLAQLLAEARLRQIGMPQLDRLAPEAVEPLPAWLGPPQAPSAVNQFAACLAGAEAERSEAVVWANPQSSEESAAIAALTPTFQSCAPPAMNVRLSRSIMRLILAVAIQRRLGDAAPVKARLVSSEKN